MNYDPSKVGVPYVRAHRISINYGINSHSPDVVIEQSLAVLLADGTVRKLDDVQALTFTLDLLNDGDTPVPMINPGTAQPIGIDTTLNKTMLSILAIVRQKQLAM